MKGAHSTGGLLVPRTSPLGRRQAASRSDLTCQDGRTRSSWWQISSYARYAHTASSGSRTGGAPGSVGSGTCRGVDAEGSRYGPEERSPPLFRPREQPQEPGGFVHPSVERPAPPFLQVVPGDESLRELSAVQRESCLEVRDREIVLLPGSLRASNAVSWQSTAGS